MNPRLDRAAAQAEARRRASAVARHGGVEAALAAGALPEIITAPLVEALVLGLLKQGVSKYLAVFGHGNTALAETLRILRGSRRDAYLAVPQ